MEIILEKNELAGALVALGKLISRTSALEANRCISIEAHEGWATFTTGTATESITYKAGCDAGIELNAIVAFDEFKEAVRNCRTRLLSISVMEGTLVIGDKVLTPKTEVNWPQMPEAPIGAVEVNLPEGFVESFQTLASVVDKDDYREILHGINISRDGFTATNGRELLNIPCELNLEGFTIALPLALMQTKVHDSGTLKKWAVNGDTFFRIEAYRWTYTAKAMNGIYPNWQHVVPKDTAMTRSFSLADADRENLMQFVKCVPNLTQHNEIILIKDGGQLKVKSINNLEAHAEATFSGDWDGFTVSISRDILHRMFSAGHTKVEFTTDSGPFKGTGGKGTFVGMPLRREVVVPQAEAKPAPQIEAKPASTEPTESTQAITVTSTPTPTQVTTPTTKPNETKPINQNSQTKENKSMYISNNANNGAAYPQPVAVSNEESNISPFDELVELINSLARKIKEVQIAQKQKERDFQTAKKIIRQLQGVTF